MLCVHLGLLGRERRYQLRRLREVIAEVSEPNEPLLLAGDFNDWRLVCDTYLRQQLGFSEVMTSLSGQVARTYPAVFPVMRMDRIYFRNMELLDGGLLSGWPWRRLSDHSALTAVFRV
jgi:endonuclease/exonuclease/phosphatase family metal-dependent hydrolase